MSGSSAPAPGSLAKPREDPMSSAPRPRAGPEPSVTSGSGGAGSYLSSHTSCNRHKEYWVWCMTTFFTYGQNAV